MAVTVARVKFLFFIVVKQYPVTTYLDARKYEVNNTSDMLHYVLLCWLLCVSRWFSH